MSDLIERTRSLGDRGTGEYSPLEHSRFFGTLKQGSEESGELATPKPAYPWVPAARQCTREVLSGVRDHVERVLARPEGSTVRVYVLFRNSTYDHGAAVAYGRLEAELGSLLRRNYDDVVVELIPTWGSDEDVLDALQQRSVPLS